MQALSDPVRCTPASLAAVRDWHVPATQVKPQTLSNLLWAYATLGRHPHALLAVLASESQRQLSHFKPQVLSALRPLPFALCPFIAPHALLLMH